MPCTGCPAPSVAPCRASPARRRPTTCRSARPPGPTHWRPTTTPSGPCPPCRRPDVRRDRAGVRPDGRGDRSARRHAHRLPPRLEQRQRAGTRRSDRVRGRSGRRERRRPDLQHADERHRPVAAAGRRRPGRSAGGRGLGIATRRAGFLRRVAADPAQEAHGRAGRDLVTAPDERPPALAMTDVSVVRGGRTVWSQGTFSVRAGAVVGVIGPNGAGAGGGGPVGSRAPFSARAGAVVGVIGPTGAGKTPLSQLALGLLPAATGGVEVRGAPPRRGNRRIGYVPQNYTAALGHA